MTRITFIKSLLFHFILLVPILLSGEIISPFNKKNIIDSTADYNFIVSGHFHGASTNTSTFPAATILAGIDTLNALKPSFLIHLGDLFLDVNEEYIAHYQRVLFDKLHMPLLNAVGNHDLSNHNMYEKIYGKSHYFFTKSTELFIVLNTELNDGNIKDEQLNEFKAALNLIKIKNIKQIFVFSHRPVWAEGNKRYSRFFKNNTQSRFGFPNYKKDILPLLQQAHVPVYWMSGSTGGGPSSFFYDKNEEDHITYIQTAIRDTPRDAVLNVSVSKGEISFKTISLTGQNLLPLEHYNFRFWSQNTSPEQSFNYRLIPYLIWLAVSHHYFWIGFFIGICFVVFLSILIKKWKKRK